MTVRGNKCKREDLGHDLQFEKDCVMNGQYEA